MTFLDKSATDTIGNMVGGRKYASKGVAGTALGLGIAGTALWLLNNDGRGLGLFGHGHHHGDKELEKQIDFNLAKENADVLALTNQIWGNALRSQENRFYDVTGINQKIFDSYVYTNAEIAGVKEDSNNKFFANYKETRDIKDQLVSEIGELKTEIAVLKAVAPYQQQLTAAAINEASQQAAINLAARTQYMLSGVLVPPTLPTQSTTSSTTTSGN